MTDKIIDKFPTSLHESEVEKKEVLFVKDIIPKSLNDIKDLEKEIFKSIESLNIDSDELQLDKADQATLQQFLQLEFLNRTMSTKLQD